MPSTQQNTHTQATGDYQVFKTFNEFFPFYLQEHSNLTNRRLHGI